MFRVTMVIMTTIALHGLFRVTLRWRCSSTGSVYKKANRPCGSRQVYCNNHTHPTLCHRSNKRGASLPTLPDDRHRVSAHSSLLTNGYELTDGMEHS